MTSQNKPADRAQSQHRRRETQQALEYLRVRGFYTTDYTEIVQPERIFAVSQYFRRYWVPLLNAGPAWLVVALRQRCFWNQQRDWCVVSRETLANESGVSVRTVDNYLNSGDLDWFLTDREARYRQTADGQKQRDWNRYHVRLDEPLIPLHQAALAALAREIREEGSIPTGSTGAVEETASQDRQNASPLTQALAIAQHLLDLGAEGLWDHLRAYGQKSEVLEAARAETEPRTIAEILLGACQEAASSPDEAPDKERRLALSRACDALYNRIVRPDKVQIATQYFRLQWLPLLGAPRAWLILDLRSRCYFNQQDLELRDTCTVGGLGELAERVGVSVSTIKTCIGQDPGPVFIHKLATRRPGRGLVEMDFQVEMIDPLTPEDEGRYQGIVGLDQMAQFADSPPDQKTVSAVSPLDQRPDFAGKDNEQEAEIAASPQGQKPEFARDPDQGAEFAVRPIDQKAKSAPIWNPTKGQDLQSTKTLYTTFTQHKHKQQQKVLLQNTNMALPLSAAVGSLETVLTGLEIENPARSKILDANPPVGRVLAWCFEALAQRHIENQVGFVISMLTAGHAPPAGLEKLFNLSVANWVELAEAVRAVRLTGRVEITRSLVGGLDLLLDRLGDMDPEQWPIVLPLPPPNQGLLVAKGPPSPKDAEPLDEHARELEAANALWALVLQQLQLQMARATFDAWLRGSRVVKQDGDVLVVAVRHPHAVDWLQNRLMASIQHTLERVAGRPMEIRFETAPP